MKAQPGHLARAGLNLKQSEKVRENLSKRQQYVEAMKKVKPVVLDWRRK